MLGDNDRYDRYSLSDNPTIPSFLLETYYGYKYIICEGYMYISLLSILIIEITMKI